MNIRFLKNWSWRKKQLKKYALRTALKSDYARRTYDFIPTWLVSYALRTIVDFVLYYRLYSQYHILNLLTAIIISTIVTITTPFFYDVIWQYREHIEKFTNHIVDHMSWEYYLKWKTRIVLITAATIIAILTQIEVTSWWLIECIIHTLVCGYILGLYEELHEKYMKPVVLHYMILDLTPRPQYVKTIQIVHTVIVAHTHPHDFQLLHDYTQPKRAQIINTQKINLKSTHRNRIIPLQPPKKKTKQYWKNPINVFMPIIIITDLLKSSTKLR